MAFHPEGNPSDESGQTQYGQIVIGTCVDNNDPDQAGKCKVRFTGHQDDQALITDETIPWLASVRPGTSQLRGIGSFPAGRYECGTKVICLSLGQQEFMILGAIPNSVEDEKTKDTHSMATNNSLVDFLFGPDKQVDKELAKTFVGKKGTKLAHQLMNQRIPTDRSPHKGDPIKSIQNHLKTPNYMGGVVGTIMKKLKMPNTIGTYKHFKGNNSLNNATKFIQELLGQKGELIPNALNMLENLKKVGAQGLNLPMVNSVGGNSLLAAAITGIAQLISSSSPDTKTKEQKDEFDLLEELLRVLYKEATGQDALDDQGNETMQYKMWKAECIKELRDQAIGAVS